MVEEGKRDRKVHWRCFHCGDTFTKAQAHWARQHFGRDEGDLPVCQMRVPGEHHLLTMLRKAQDELDAHRAEDTDLWRSLYAMEADHAAALRREEERGYEKGLADGRALRLAYGPSEERLHYVGEPSLGKAGDAIRLVVREAWSLCDGAEDRMDGSHLVDARPLMSAIANLEDLIPYEQQPASAGHAVTLFWTSPDAEGVAK